VKNESVLTDRLIFADRILYRKVRNTSHRGCIHSNCKWTKTSRAFENENKKYEQIKDRCI
jgi:hypothetical protein